HRCAEDGPPRILRPLQADRPADLAQSGGNQICPGDRHVLRPLPLAIRGTIAKDDSRFVTAGSASLSTEMAPPAHGSGALPDCVNTFRLKDSLLITGRKQGRGPDNRFLQPQVGSSCEPNIEGGVCRDSVIFRPGGANGCE